MGGVTTLDIFGTATASQPAEPCSYEEAPNGCRLPDGTRLGAVRLQIADLQRSLAFYPGETRTRDPWGTDIRIRPFVGNGAGQ